MATDILEQRVSALEKEVREIQLKMAGSAAAGTWLHQMIGAFKDEPAFDEVAAYGREYRESQSHASDSGDDE